MKLAPRKPDWDLKRDVAKKLEKLERRTQRAIAQLIRTLAVCCLALPSEYIGGRVFQVVVLCVVLLLPSLGSCWNFKLIFPKFFQNLSVDFVRLFNI